MTEEEQFAEQLTGRMPIQKFLKEMLLDKVNEAVLFITITDSLCVHLNTKFSYKALALRHHNMPCRICAEGDLPERERIRKSMQQHLEATKQLRGSAVWRRRGVAATCCSIRCGCKWKLTSLSRQPAAARYTRTTRVYSVCADRKRGFGSICAWKSFEVLVAILRVSPFP